MNTIPQVCIDKINLAALKIAGSQKTFTRDEIEQLAVKVGEKITFVMDLKSIIRVLECKFIIHIPKTYSQLVDEAVENGKSTILYNGQIISII
jgi:SpoU rRNA methylase family enzyme